MIIRKRKPLYKQESIIEKIDLNNVDYNTRVESYPNIESLIFDGKDIKRVQDMKNNCINPKLNLFFKSKKDTHTYKLYFIDKAMYNGSTHYEFEFDDPKTDGIREFIDASLKFNFKIESGELVLELLRGDKNTYSLQFILKLINSKMDNCVKKYILKSLQENGYIDTVQNMYNLCKRIEDCVNSEILNQYGIVISNINIKIKEDPNYFKKRNTVCWKLFEKEALNNAIN